MFSVYLSLLPFNGDKTVPGYDKSPIVIGEGNTTSNLTGFFTGGDTSSLSTDLTELIDFTKLIQLSSHIKDGEQEAFWTELSEELKNAMMTAMTGKKIYLKTFGGTYIPNSISIYPVNFDNKDKVTDYLKDWNKIEGKDAKRTTEHNVRMCNASGGRGGRELSGWQNETSIAEIGV